MQGHPPYVIHLDDSLEGGREMCNSHARVIHLEAIKPQKASVGRIKSLGEGWSTIE